MIDNLDGALLQVRTARNSNERDRAVADALEEIAKVLHAKENVAILLDLGDYVPKEATHVLVPVSVLEELRKARYGKGMDFDSIDEHVSVDLPGQHDPMPAMHPRDVTERPAETDLVRDYLFHLPARHGKALGQAVARQLKREVMPRPAWAPDAPPSRKWLVDGHCPECHSAVKDMSIGGALSLRCTNEACAWWWWD